MNTPKIVAASIPPKTAVPSERLLLAPAPLAITSGITIFPACQAASDTNTQKSKLIYDSSNKSHKVTLNEYIIVIKESSNIDNAIETLKKYDARILRDLKRNHYLIGLVNDPGIEQLKIDIQNNMYIKYIQPNYRYELQ